MFDNCHKYNKRNVGVKDLATSLEAHFNKRMARSFKGYMCRTVRKAMASVENPFLADVPESCLFAPPVVATPAVAEKPKVPRRELIRGEGGAYIRLGGQPSLSAVVTDDEDYADRQVN